MYPSSPDSGRRGFKRRAGSDHSITRTQFRNEATAKGDVHVVEIDPEGKFVRLENKSSEVNMNLIYLRDCYLSTWVVQDSVIGGWYLRMRADNDKEKDTRYKIPQNRTIKAFSTITVSGYFPAKSCINQNGSKSVCTDCSAPFYSFGQDLVKVWKVEVEGFNQ